MGYHEDRKIAEYHITKKEPYRCPICRTEVTEPVCPDCQMDYSPEKESWGNRFVREIVFLGSSFILGAFIYGVEEFKDMAYMGHSHPLVNIIVRVGLGLLILFYVGYHTTASISAYLHRRETSLELEDYLKNKRRIEARAKDVPSYDFTDQLMYLTLEIKELLDVERKQTQILMINLSFLAAGFMLMTYLFYK